MPATGAQGADARRATAYRPAQPAGRGGGPGSDGPLGRVPPTVLILSGGISVQIGAGLAARLFTQLPAAADVAGSTCTRQPSRARSRGVAALMPRSTAATTNLAGCPAGGSTV